MKYLDERIILTVPNLTIPEDGLYQYEIGIADEWVASDPYFVGNCFIQKNATERNIDITDIVRNEIDFDKDVDFQEEWQVRIKVGENYYYSNSETILPIYRYPNRKAEMETPIELNKDGWYIPSLQGFDAQKKAKMLPHIPYLATKELSYELWMNNGKMTTTPYLYSGVEKNLDNNSYGIRKNSWKLEDLWKGSTVLKKMNPVPTYDSNLLGYSDEDDLSDYFSRGESSVSFKNLPYQIAQYKILSPFANVPDVDWTDFAYTGDWGSRVCNPTFNRINKSYGWKFSYIDLYLNESNGDDLINIYPSFDTSATSAYYQLRMHFREKLNYPTYEWLSTTDGTKDAPPDYYFANLKDTAYNVYLLDADGNRLLNLTIGAEKTTSIKVTGIRTITINDVVNNTVLATLAVINTEAFDNERYDFRLHTKADTSGVYIGIYQSVWDGDINFDMAQYLPVTEEAEKVENIRVQTGNQSYKLKGSPITITKNLEDYIYFDEENIQNYDSFSDNEVILPFSEQDILENQTAAKGSFYCEVRQYNINNNEVGNNDVVNLFNYSYGKPYTYPTYYAVNMLAQYCEFLILTYSNKVDDYFSQIPVRFKPILNNKVVKSISFAYEKASLQILGLTYYDTEITEAPGFDVATIDYCPSRYYLQWRDRYGSQQTQPFGKTETYSESFTRSEVKNYQNVRRLANVDIQPKWKINSGWMNDSVYPYYESLFVSPSLRLYDSKEDKSYDVIITDSEYTEKTYKNQGRQLFNLELQLEEVKTQKILY